MPESKGGSIYFSQLREMAFTARIERRKFLLLATKDLAFTAICFLAFVCEMQVVVLFGQVLHFDLKFVTLHSFVKCIELCYSIRFCT